MSLASYRVATMIRCKDLTVQKRFYTEVLGLRINRTYPSGEIMLEAGKGTELGLYPGEPSKADHTVACFTVDDIDAVIKVLEAKGVKFADFDLPGFKTVNHVVTTDGHKGAWFQDPEGNFIGVGQDAK
jgi:catechol 2,3-dioxygenase-like lactoylglutathione lyase family enzyme